MLSKYNKKLWAVCREYGVGKELLYQIAEDELGIYHISECSTQELIYLIDRIKGKPVDKPSPKGMASAAQKGMIKHLTEQLGWDKPERLAGFIKKYAKVDSIDWLTKRQASAVIEGLKKLLEKKV